jgi:transcriptional regulator with XRE-family HTH domain
MFNSIAGKLNALRQAKHIPVSAVENAGVSRTTYYRFLRGGTDITVPELLALMKIMTVSFSELLADFAEQDLLMIQMEQMVNLDVEDLMALQEELQNTYHLELYYDRKIMLKVVSFLLTRRAGGSTSAIVKDIYKTINRNEFFTLFDMRVVVLIAPDLTPQRFFRLYQKFVQSIQSYQNYMPSSLFEMSLMMHITALNKMIVESKQRNRDMIEFVFQAIYYQPKLASNNELYILQNFIGKIITFLIARTESSVPEITKFLSAAERLAVTDISMHHLSVNLRDVWDIISQHADEITQPVAEPTKIVRFHDLPVRRNAKSVGGLMNDIIRAKKVTLKDLSQIGFSNAKVYRFYKGTTPLRVSELIDLMRITGLEPGDLDALLTRVMSTNRSNKYPATLTDLSLFDAAEEEFTIYEADTTRNDHYEQALLLKARAASYRNAGWYASDDALSLAEEARDLLARLDTWDESEYLLVKIAMMAIDTPEQARIWLSKIVQDGNNARITRVYTNRVIDAVEFAIFRNLLLQNDTLVSVFVDLALNAGLNDPKTKRYVAWRWRISLYEYYKEYLKAPHETMQNLFNFLSDFERLVNNGPIVARYKLVYVELWGQRN